MNLFYFVEPVKLKNISEEDAISGTNNYERGLEISNVETINETGKHHEYRKTSSAYIY